MGKLKGGFGFHFGGAKSPSPNGWGKLVNRIFFDGAPDYVASSGVTDYTIDGVKYSEKTPILGLLRGELSQRRPNIRGD